MGRPGRSRRRAERRLAEAAAQQRLKAEIATRVNAAAEASKSTITIASIGSDSTEDSYIWSGAKEKSAGSNAESAAGSGSGQGLKKQPARSDLSSASKQSLGNSAAEPFETALGVPLTAQALSQVPGGEQAEMPNSRPHVWDVSHDKNPEEHRPPIDRPGKTEEDGGLPGLDFPSEGRLCVDAFEQEFEAGKKEVDAQLMRKVVDYYEEKVENLVVMALEGRGKIAEVMKVVQERVKDVEAKNRLYTQLLELKTTEEVKRNYDELDEENKGNEELHAVDQELIRHFEEEEKKKDARIEQLEDDLQRAKKEIALASLQAQKSGAGINTKDSHVSPARSEDSGLGGSDKSHASNVSNASMDTTISSANANIHLIEMSILHSRKNYRDASKAAARAEKHIQSCDAKTQLAVKAWHASTLALAAEVDNENMDLSRRLFEDALFIARSLKGQSRKDGKAWEDKCNAWLTHLSEVDKKRGQSTNTSPKTSRVRGNAEAAKRIHPQKESKCTPSRQDMSAAQATTLSNELNTAHLYSSSNSGRSSQELPALPPQPLGGRLDYVEQPLSSPPLSGSLPPSSPPLPQRSSQEWPTQLSRSLANELSGLDSPSPTSDRSREEPEPAQPSRSLGDELAGLDSSPTPDRSRNSDTVLDMPLPHGDTVVDVDVDEFSPSNVLDIQFNGSESEGAASPGEPPQEITHHGTEEKPSATLRLLPRKLW